MQKNTKLSIMEFKEYCDNISSQCYVFDTYNQAWKSDVTTMSMAFRFDGMIISCNPNRICFTLGEKDFFGKFLNYLRLERVKYVVYKEQIAESHVFSIVCGGWSDDSDEHEYKISLK